MRLIIWLLFTIPLVGNAHSGRVVDSETGEPLAFASIGLKGSSSGTISNEDGYFNIDFAEKGDTLVFSFLGYEPFEIAYINLKERVKLKRKSLELTEFTVMADSDPYFDILAKCRKELKKNTLNTCRAYLELHTRTLNTPGEVIEMYYNAKVRSGNLHNLTYKSGRQGIAKIDNSYFLSLSTTNIFKRFRPTEGDANMPTNPLELSKRKMKTTYKLSLLSAGDNDPYFHILFEPKANSESTFSGEIFVDKTTYRPIEIKLFIENAQVKPFEPIFPSDSLVDIKMTIIQRFEDFEGDLVPSLLRFEYAFDSYIPIESDKPIGKNNLKKIKPVQSDGILYYYNHADPFIEPTFQHTAALNDYQKIQNTPYHKAFWELSPALVQSERMNESLEFFEKHGRLHNHSSVLDDNLFKGIQSIVDHTNPFWSDSTRLRFSDDFRKKLEAEETDPRYALPRRAKYHLKTEIYLDIVQTQDTVVFHSKPVFDVFESFYNLPGDSLTNPFLNIYFDLTEIEHRAMNAQINRLENPKPDAILQIHNRSTERLENELEVYLKQTDSGSNYQELLKYNEMVSQKLGIDNFEIFGIKGF
ncbi:MAG: carboxypeptidase-like regulatory domain-containing protein [Cryomorphaceae bacterium]|nr:carboxypeptidase-like regulatory domain-containing protein [Flavobacteriales bacterium]